MSSHTIVLGGAPATDAASPCVLSGFISFSHSCVAFSSIQNTQYIQFDFTTAPDL